MNYLKRFAGLWMLLVALSVLSFGQEQTTEAKPPQSVSGNSTYKLDFVLTEMQNGKRINSRAYSMLTREGENAKIRLGDRVPVPASGGQYQYVEIGTNLDARPAKEVEGGLPLRVLASVESMLPEQQGEKLPVPMVRHLSYEVDAVVPLGRQTLISSADELVGERHLQIEVTAVKVR